MNLDRKAEMSFIKIIVYFYLFQMIEQRRRVVFSEPANPLYDHITRFFICIYLKFISDFQSVRVKRIQVAWLFYILVPVN